MFCGRALTVCGAVLMAFAIVVGGCDSASISSLSTTPTVASTTAATSTIASLVQASTEIPTPAPTSTDPQQSFPTAVLGPGFAGTYFYDGRPYFLYFLSLTQAGSEVAGYLNIVNLDGKGGTKAATYPLNGKSDSDTVTLNERSSGRVYTFSKTKAQDGSVQFTFSVPGPSGQIITQDMTPASQYEFNSLLGGWQASLGDERQVTQDIAGKFETLSKWISYIEQETRSLNDKLSTIRQIVLSPLATGYYSEAWALDDIYSELTTVKEKSAIRPMSCVDYDGVAYYYSSMKSTYDEFAKQRGKFAKEVSTLENSLTEEGVHVTGIQDAAQALDQAMKNSAYPYKVSGPMPGDETTAITDYQEAADAARSQVADLKATDAANQTTADGYMAEGKAVLDGAKALVNCPP